MESLAAIAAEAARVGGRLPEARRRALQERLIALCQRHWEELRGPEPATPLAHALWSTAPPAADLVADLLAKGNGRVSAAAEGLSEAQVFALLADWALAHNDPDAAHAAYAPMMLFATPGAGGVYVKRVASLLRGELALREPHRHAPLPPVTRALALIAAATGRCDAAAVRETLRLLTDATVSDPAVSALRARLAAAGVRLVGLEDGDVQFEQRGHPHGRLTGHQLSEALAQLRAQWLA